MNTTISTQVELVERTCSCGISFRVMPDSDQHDCGRPSCPGVNPTKKWKTHRPKPESRLAIPSSDLPWNKSTKPVTWRECVDAAKICVVRMDKYRMFIAELAIKACEIHWGGGGHWNNFKGKNLLKDFADEAGIGRKTLYEWVRVRRNVIDKLPEDMQEDAAKPENYKHINRIVTGKKGITRDTPAKKIQTLYEAEKNRSAESARMPYLLRAARHCRNMVGGKMNLDECDTGELKELRALCKSIYTRLGVYLNK